jgi:hypothetical protein
MTDTIEIHFPEGGAWSATGLGVTIDEADVGSIRAWTRGHGGSQEQRLLDLIEPVLEAGFDVPNFLGADEAEWKFRRWGGEDDNAIAIYDRFEPNETVPEHTTTYTVLDQHGEVKAEGFSLRDAAREVLHQDGHDYEIVWRPATGFFELHVTVQGGGGNVPKKSVHVHTLAKSRALAEHQIYEQVVQEADVMGMGDWTVLTDEEHRKMREEDLREAGYA